MTRERLAWAAALTLAFIWGISGAVDPSISDQTLITALVQDLGDADLEVAVDAAVRLGLFHPNWGGLALRSVPNCLAPEFGQRRAMASLACALMVPPDFAALSPQLRQQYSFCPGVPLTASETATLARGLGSLADRSAGKMRTTAVNVLVTLGAGARPAMATLRRVATDDADSSATAYARLALLQCGQGSLDPVLRLLTDTGWQIGDHWGEVIGFLDEVDWEPDRVGPALLAKADNYWHMHALGTIGCQARATLQALIDSPPDLLRIHSYVGRMGRDCPEVVLPFLHRELHSDDWYYAAEAASGLAEVGPPAAEAVHDLCTILLEGVPEMKESESQHVREKVARALGMIGVDTPPVLQALRQARSDRERSVRREANLALARLGHDIPEAVAMILERLEAPNSPDSWVFGWDAVDAIDELTAIGPPARAAAPALIALVIGETFVQDYHIYPKGPVPAFSRHAAARALGALGEPDAATIAALTSALTDSNAQVRTAAAEALARLGPLGLDALCNNLGNDRADISAAAAWALADAGQPAVPHLQHARTSGNRRAKIEAEFVLDWIE